MPKRPAEPPPVPLDMPPWRPTPQLIRALALLLVNIAERKAHCPADAPPCETERVK